MFKVAIFIAVVAVAHAGIIAPVIPVAHPVVHHVAVARPAVATVSHSAVVHPVPVVHHAPVVHAAPLVHAAPIVHHPVVPVVRHAPIVAVHH